MFCTHLNVYLKVIADCSGRGGHATFHRTGVHHSAFSHYFCKTLSISKTTRSTKTRSSFGIAGSSPVTKKTIPQNHSKRHSSSIVLKLFVHEHVQEV